MCWGQLGVALHGHEALPVACLREGPGTHPVRGAKGFPGLGTSASLGDTEQ